MQLLKRPGYSMFGSELRHTARCIHFAAGVQAAKAEAAVAAVVATQAEALAAAGLPAPELPSSEPCLQGSLRGSLQGSSDAQQAKQREGSKSSTGVSITATSRASTQQEAGSNPQQGAAILPRVRGPSSAAPQASPPALRPVHEASYSLLQQRHDTASASGNIDARAGINSASSSAAASRDASPAPVPLNAAPPSNAAAAVQQSAKAARNRHTHFASTLPACFAGFSHGDTQQQPGQQRLGQLHTARPASAATPGSGVGRGWQR